MELRQQAARYAEAYMSSDKFDASHDWSHIQRVLQTSLSLAAAERQRPQAPDYDLDVIHLAALLHDITDHKYVDASEEEGDLENKISRILQGMGASPSLAQRVQLVCAHVSYSQEMRDPEAVRRVLSLHPELAIVQDADRLDAIGAVGIARVFAFTGAASARGKSRSIEGTFEHFHEKLERIRAHMKTEEGRRRAERGTRRLEEFRGWFTDETGLDV